MMNTDTLLTILVLAGAVLAVAMLILTVVVMRRAGRGRRADAIRRESEEQFTALVKGVTDYAIFMLDPEGRVVSWNPGAERNKGYAAEEIIGQHFSRFYTDEDRAAGVPQRALQAAREKGKYEAEGWRVRKDGTRFFASVVIDPLREPSGRLIGYAKITRDVTERMQQQQALAETQAALAQSQKMEAVGQLSGGIAHDFNNLLHVITNATEALNRKLQTSDPEIGHLLTMVRRNADRAASLTQRLLAFSRRQPLEPRALDANRLVQGMADLLHSSLGESISVEVVSGSGLWQILADPNQLETAILNLAVNARDAMPNGGKLTIETTNAFLDETYTLSYKDVMPGQYVMIAVSDTGTGMTKEVLSKAFDPFFTTKEVGQGTGLGLSQVYGFIKQSGGHVKIYSEVDRGTTIKLYLPRLVTAAALDDRKEIDFVHDARAKGTILLVEDEEDVRQFTTQVLRELGYQVTAASNGMSALAALQTMKQLDLLFTDIGLPDGMNGRQLADEVTRRRPGLRVLFTTGYARNAIIHDGRLDPGVDVIVKPFTQASLGRKLEKMLSIPS
jgi:PAS domain S-box-containing protein